MKRRPRLALLCLAGVLLAACAPEPSPGGQPPAPESSAAVVPEPAPVPRVDFLTVGHIDVPGLHTVSTGDERSRIHTVLPQISGHDALNTALASIADVQAREFRRAMGEGDRGFLSVSWSALGVSPRVMGFLVSSQMSPGGSSAERIDAVWYDVRDERLLSWRDFVVDDAQLSIVERVLAQLRRRVSEPETDAARSILMRGNPAVGFDVEGELVLGFSEYEVAAGSYGMPMFAVRIPDSSLTERGRLARGAALHPRALVPTPTPEPAPAPSPKPVPAPEKKKRVDCRTSACVALTFDDGPAARTTPALLDILKKQRTPATFFVLGGQVQAFPAVLRRAAAEGHEIASHTWSHAQLTALDEEDLRREITRTGTAIEKVTGRRPTLLRPPYGARDAKVDRVVKELGYAQVLWSVDTLDWRSHDAKKILAAASKAKRGAIILLHDIHPDTVKAVPSVIAALRKKGFTLVTVSELIGAPKAGERYYGRY